MRKIHHQVCFFKLYMLLYICLKITADVLIGTGCWGGLTIMCISVIFKGAFYVSQFMALVDQLDGW